MKIAEINIAFINGSTLTTYKPVKSQKEMKKWVNKKFEEDKSIVVSDIKFNAHDVDYISWKLHEVN